MKGAFFHLAVQGTICHWRGVSGFDCMCLISLQFFRHSASCAWFIQARSLRGPTQSRKNSMEPGPPPVLIHSFISSWARNFMQHRGIVEWHLLKYNQLNVMNIFYYFRERIGQPFFITVPIFMMSAKMSACPLFFYFSTRQRCEWHLGQGFKPDFVPI